MPRNRTDLTALRNMIAEADKLLQTTTLPEGRAERAHELLGSAIALANILLAEKPAAVLGKKGGLATKASRGPDYFKKIAAMRKTRAGGRPKKHNPSERPTSILGGLEWIIHSNSNRTWTVRQLETALRSLGYELQAENPVATLGVAMKKLCDRNRVTVVRRGSGREPHIYQATRIVPAEAEEGEIT